MHFDGILEAFWEQVGSILDEFRKIFGVWRRLGAILDAIGRSWRQLAGSNAYQVRQLVDSILFVSGIDFYASSFLQVYVACILKAYRKHLESILLTAQSK